MVVSKWEPENASSSTLGLCSNTAPHHEVSRRGFSARKDSAGVWRRIWKEESTLWWALFQKFPTKIQLFFTIKYFHESSLAHGYTEDETDTRRQASLGSKAFFTHCRWNVYGLCQVTQRITITTTAYAMHFLHAWEMQKCCLSGYLETSEQRLGYYTTYTKTWEKGGSGRWVFKEDLINTKYFMNGKNKFSICSIAILNMRNL